MHTPYHYLKTPAVLFDIYLATDRVVSYWLRLAGYGLLPRFSFIMLREWDGTASV